MVGEAGAEPHVTSQPRSEVLGRIRRALGERGADRSGDYEAIPRAYRQVGGLSPTARLALFVVRLEDYGVAVHRCRPQMLPQTIARALIGRGNRRLIVPPALPAEWLPVDCEFVPDSDVSYAELDGSAGVVTGCTVGIALTGTIVLCHWALEGRRALTLVPDYHLCIVGSEQVVETVPEAFRLIEALRPSLVTTISGPSATADIEMTRVKGVHGPRTLDVILIER
jgi:L-lactate dehydrogenase complex protein LldG